MDWSYILPFLAVAFVMFFMMRGGGGCCGGGHHSHGEPHNRQSDSKPDKQKE